MAAPVASIAIDPAEADLSDNGDPIGAAAVNATDEGTYDPAATARVWKVDGTALAAPDGAAVGDLDDVDITFHAPGEYDISIEVTNGDGKDESDTTTVEIVDSYSDEFAMIPGTARIHPADLPWAYQNPLVASPGLPTAYGVLNAETTGTVAAPPPSVSLP